jgi:dTDP-4-dehydrorhamnose 3,5-epimerase
MSHTIEPLEIPGLALVRTKQFADARGIFCETWSAASFQRLGLRVNFLQDNQSLSISQGTVRGLHYQKEPFAQAKLLRVIVGAIFDVAVDIRAGSPTFGKAVSTILDDRSGDQLFIPKGFAHGFMTLKKGSIISYKVDAPYNPSSERGIVWNDPALGIEWPDVGRRAILSEKDAILPAFKDADV